MWLNLGEWTLKHRWRLVAVASILVISFEMLEYMPHQKGINAHFLFEALTYGVFLPISTGLALSALSASRSELAWSIYYQNLKRNLDRQLYTARSYDELADIFLQFVRVVMPLVGATLYKYDQATHSYKTILDWFMEKDRPPDFSNPAVQCTAEGCPLLAVDVGDEAMSLQSCFDLKMAGASGNSAGFCIPFSFSNARVAAARFHFADNHTPSFEQERLLKEIAPVVATGLRRLELEQLMKKRHDSVNAEQQRLARDVHDSLGHSLAYLRLRLDQISTGFNRTQLDTLQQEVEALRDVAKEAYDQMREVLVALSPHSNVNISNLLLNYAERISQRANFKVQIHQSGQQHALPPVTQRNIFYIFQEAITNIEKHAHAHLVDVDLHWQEAEFMITIKDDGVGYDSSLSIPHGHFGLTNMRERALESHGELSISSQPSEGTHLTLCIPYEETP